MEQTEKTLVALGFAEEEARVYIACLALGKASVTDIARKTSLKRTSVYHYIETLLAQELLSKDVVGRRMVYIPQNPERILKDLEKRRTKLREILPTLTQAYTEVRHKPRVEFLENRNEVRRAYFSFGESFVPTYSIFSVASIQVVLSPQEVRELNVSLHERGVDLYDLVAHEPEGKEYLRTYKRGVHRVKLLPKEFQLTTDVLVTGNRVLLVSFRNRMGIIVESDDLAEFFRNMFLFMWGKV